MQTSQQCGDSKLGPGEYQKKERFSAWHFYDGALNDQPSRAARRNSKQTRFQYGFNRYFYCDRSSTAINDCQCNKKFDWSNNSDPILRRTCEAIYSFTVLHLMMIR